MRMIFPFMVVICVVLHVHIFLGDFFFYFLLTSIPTARLMRSETKSM